MAFLDKAGLERLWLHINSKLNKINNATKVIDKATGDSLSINNSANQKPIGVKLFGKTSQSSVPTLETPSPLVHLGQDGNIKTTFCGKNLVDINKFQASNSASAKEVTDDTIRVYTITNRVYAGCHLSSVHLIKGQTYTLSASVDSIVAGTPRIGFRETATNAFISGTSLLFSETGRKSITFTASRTVSAYLSILVTWDTETNGDATFSNIQVEMNNQETEYEPYKDGGFITISTPNGLRGMKVTEGGNYTDQYGQQWIADEADLVSNTINTRIREYIIDGRAEQSISTIETLTNVVRFWAYIPELKGMSTSANNYIMCDKLPVANSYEEDSIGILNGTTIGPGYPRSIVLKLPLAAGTTTAALQAYLAANPLSVMTVVNEVEEVSLEVNSEELYMQNPITNVNNTDVAGLEVEYATTKMDDLKEALDGTLQSDWEQNDENANDYVKNRTHWEEPLITNMLVDNVSVTVPTSSAQVIDPFAMDIVLGTTYLVTFDDVMYECVAYLDPIYFKLTIGNLRAVSPTPYVDTGEPFFIQSYQDSVALSASGGTHIITIQEVVSGGAHKIDPKFLYTPDWNAQENEPGYIANKTHWSDFEYETVIDNLSITLMEANGAYAASIPLINLGAGSLETIWNGVSYKTSIGMTPDGHSYFTGNPAILYPSYAPDNGLPFGIGFSYSGATFVCLEIPASPVLTIKVLTETVHKIDTKYLPEIATNLVNGSATGSVRGIGTIEESETYTMGSYAFAEGSNTTASGHYSHAEGFTSQATGLFGHAEGRETTASGEASHAENYLTIAEGSYSHAEGSNTSAAGGSSHAEGNNTVASGYTSHAEGDDTQATKNSSHAEGSNTKATADCTHAEGSYTEASGWASHAEGGHTKATNNYAHAEGNHTTASGYNSHAEGANTTASGEYSHAEGQGTIANNDCAHAEGYYTNAEAYAHAEGYYTIAGSSYQHVQGKYNIEDTDDKYAHIVGNGTQQTPSNAHTVDWDGNAWFAGNIYVGGSGQEDTENIQQLATQEDVVNTATTIVNEGKLKNIFDGNALGSVQTSGSNYGNDENYTIGSFAFAEGYGTTATGIYSHAEGHRTTASGDSSHVEGDNTEASEDYSHAEGFYTTASGLCSHAEGSHTTASKNCAHAEGYYTTASGDYSHAEGSDTTASGNKSHTEGYHTTASGVNSHAEGNYTTASSDNSHAEGNNTTASGAGSHAEGLYTIATSNNQHVQGKYNIEDTSNKYAHIVGNGNYQTRSNAHTLDWNGNAWFAGNIKIGGTDQSDTAASLIATQNYVLEQLEVISDDEITSICS